MIDGVPRISPRVLLLLLAAFTLFAPLSYSEVPDQTWLGGVWDADDNDTVVFQLEATGAAITFFALGNVDPILVVLDQIHRRVRTALASAVIGTDPSRAPPSR